jgi:protease I
VNAAIADADPSGCHALVLPGGVANPDQFRTVPEALEFVQATFRAGKPAAVICHGPWTLVEADLVRGGYWQSPSALAS